MKATGQEFKPDHDQLQKAKDVIESFGPKPITDEELAEQLHIWYLEAIAKKLKRLRNIEPAPNTNSKGSDE